METTEKKKRGRPRGSKNKTSSDNGAENVVAMNRTEDLPGVEGVGVSPKRIKAVENAADAYVVERDKRMAATEKEVKAKRKLSDVMHAHADEIGTGEDGELRYVYNGGDKDRRVITLKPSDEKLNVKDVEAFEE